jgi:microcystin-dependent protein
VDQYLGEIRLCAFPYAPKGWALCNGALLSIQQNQALFALLGIQYGGNGTTVFQLPDLRGRTPVHRSLDGQYVQGQPGGVETVTLTTATIPAHNHLFKATTTAATLAIPGTASNSYLAQPGASLFAPVNASSIVPMDAAASDATGGSTPHDNMQPSLVMNYIIALTGIFPSRN